MPFKAPSKRSCIFLASSHPHRIFAPASHLHTFASQILTSQVVHILHLHIRTWSHLRSSYLVSSHLRHICSLSHLRSSHLRSSYPISLSSSGLHILKPHLVFTILGLHDVVTLSYLIKIFKISLSYIYNLIYLRLQNLISLIIISPLSGQPSSSVRRNVRKYVNRYVRRYVKRYVRKECQKKSQKKCQKICQKKCQKICQKI